MQNSKSQRDNELDKQGIGCMDRRQGQRVRPEYAGNRNGVKAGLEFARLAENRSD